MSDLYPEVTISLAGRLGRYAEDLAAPFEDRLRRAGRDAGLTGDHELSVVLCDGPTIRQINRKWRNKDKPTNVLSFPLHEMAAGDEPLAGALGDIVLALPVARQEARAQGLQFDHHATHLLVHGLLHLLGYDHEHDSEAEIMEAEERRILKMLGI